VITYANPPFGTINAAGSPEHLRIVDEALWDQVQRRKAADAAQPTEVRAVRRKPGVFSGLLKCGLCGGAYTPSAVTTWSAATTASAAHRFARTTGACAALRSKPPLSRA
jgi:hypothetical protein